MLHHDDVRPVVACADATLRGLVERLRERNLKTAVVTTPEGKLMGLLRREDGEARLRQAE